MKVKYNLKDVTEYNHMCERVGWGKYDENIAERMLDSNLYSVSIYEDDTIIGYGRLIGDGTFIYVHDVMVDPDYQGKKVGAKIMSELLKEIKRIESENSEAITYLGASKGKEGFYEKFGFVDRIEYGLGAGMIFDEEFKK